MSFNFYLFSIFCGISLIILLFSDKNNQILTHFICKPLTIFLSGALLFTISDMILAIRQFKGDFPFAFQLVYLTYFPAQYLFCITIWMNNYK